MLDKEITGGGIYWTVPTPLSPRFDPLADAMRKAAERSHTQQAPSPAVRTVDPKSLPPYIQVRVENPNDASLRIALMWHHAFDPGDWHVRGWMRIGPNEMLRARVPTNEPYLYYYAESDNTPFVERGAKAKYPAVVGKDRDEQFDTVDGMIQSGKKSKIVDMAALKITGPSVLLVLEPTSLSTGAKVAIVGGAVLAGLGLMVMTAPSVEELRRTASRDAPSDAYPYPNGIQPKVKR